MTPVSTREASIPSRPIPAPGMDAATAEVTSIPRRTVVRAITAVAWAIQVETVGAAEATAEVEAVMASRRASPVQ